MPWFIAELPTGNRLIEADSMYRAAQVVHRDTTTVQQDGWLKVRKATEDEIAAGSQAEGDEHE